MEISQEGAKNLSLITFVASSDAERDAIVSESRVYKIVGEFLVWRHDEEDVFNYIRLFDENMSALEKNNKLIELPVH